MNLNLPIINQLENCKNILIAGMGGGFDIFCGLPLYFELQSQGFTVHLASLTDSSLKRLRGARRLTPSLIGVLPTTESFTPYFPEQHLAKWFKEVENQDIIIWCFEKLGVRQLTNNYRTLTDYLHIDAIILVDGGVDSLIRGDEYETGSVLEDFASLATVSQLDYIPVRISTCLGFGAEREITHTHILENVASLAKNNAFWGSCSLTKMMPVFQKYEDALFYAQSQPRQDSSVINSSVISSVRGEYGNFHLTEKTRDSHFQLWISPFMAIYWFFALHGVVKQNLFIKAIMNTETFEDIHQIISQRRKTLDKRTDFRIPL